jgi:hypothetical protein
MLVSTPHPNMKFQVAEFFHADGRMYRFSFKFPAVFVRFSLKLSSLDNLFSLTPTPPIMKFHGAEFFHADGWMYPKRNEHKEGRTEERT